MRLRWGSILTVIVLLVGCSRTVTLDQVVCGDGRLDDGEVCDDGNTAGGDGCSADCGSDESCGNGVLDGELGEECDHGEANSNGPNAECRTDCRLQGCGDGVLDDGEVCDDGNTTSGDGCNADCSFVDGCGNGVLEVHLGEECDEGEDNNDEPNAEACRTDCAPRR